MALAQVAPMRALVSRIGDLVDQADAELLAIYLDLDEALAFLDGKRAQASLFDTLKDNEIVKGIRDGSVTVDEHNGIPRITVKVD